MAASSSLPITLHDLVLDQLQISAPKMEPGNISMNGCSKSGRDCKDDRKLWTFFGKETTYWVLMVASSAALVLGLSSASLLGRYYYVHGGSRMWVYTWIQSSGWPILIVPLICGYWQRGQTTTFLHIMFPKPTHSITPRLCLIYTVLGGLITFDNLLYSLGCSYLPVSTNALLCSSQLAFNALFAYLLVGQKMSPYILNSIVIISIGTILLGIGAGSSDKPLGTTQREYIIGIIVTIIASGLYALLLPLLQLVYKSKDVQAAPHAEAIGSIGRSLSTIRPTNTPSDLPLETNITVASTPPPSFLLVLEVQVAVSSFASMFAFLGMCINGDLTAMHAEALNFDGGLLAYIMTLTWSAIGWQLYFLGGSGIIFLSSSLMSCVFSTVMIPILPILAIIFFQDSFSATKGIAMVLSIWGFLSYIYDGYVAHKSRKPLRMTIDDQFEGV